MRLSKPRKIICASLFFIGLFLFLILTLPTLFGERGFMQPIAFFKEIFIEFVDFPIFLLPFWFFAEAVLVFFRKANSGGGKLLLFSICPLTVFSVFIQIVGDRAPILAARMGGDSSHYKWILLNIVLFLIFAVEIALFIWYARILIKQSSKHPLVESEPEESERESKSFRPNLIQLLNEKRLQLKNFLSPDPLVNEEKTSERDGSSIYTGIEKIKSMFTEEPDQNTGLRAMEAISYPNPEDRPRFRKDVNQPAAEPPADTAVDTRKFSDQETIPDDAFTNKIGTDEPSDNDEFFGENETVISIPEENEDSFAFFEQDDEESIPEAPVFTETNDRSATQTAAAARKRRSSGYKLPGKELLSQHQESQYWIIDEDTKEAAEILRRTLEEFGIQAQVTGITRGPVVTMFELLPAPGVKLSKIANLADNIALRLAAGRVRIVAPIPGKHAVGIEVPNRKRALVSFKELIEDPAFKKSTAAIPVILGKDITGETQVIDLTSTPHLLIAGSTGSGKSVCVNSIITSVLYKKSPEEVRMILIDPKIVELKMYNDIPHLLTPVITDAKRAYMALQYGLSEMERRYNLLDALGARNIESYNKKAKESGMTAPHLPYILIVIDEFADLMAANRKDLEQAIARLAAMSRAVGIHLILATQRPSVDVITGLIKANIPSRIAFMTASKIDSRTILDTVGAEKLLGKGDMLYVSSSNPYPTRIQGTYLSEHEVETVTDYVKTLGEPDYLDDEIFMDESEILEDNGDDDPLFDEALQIVVQTGKASASYLQRRLQVGYNRAARMIETMEARGYIGPQNGSKPREVLVSADRI